MKIAIRLRFLSTRWLFGHSEPAFETSRTSATRRCASFDGRFAQRTTLLAPLLLLSSCRFVTNSLVADASLEAMFRGSINRSGVYEDSGRSIYSGLLWRTQTNGAVRSSPTVAGNLVLVGSSDCHLYALDANSGRERWKFNTDSAVASSAAVSSGRVFFSSYTTFYAVSLRDGKLLWKYQFGSDAPLAYVREIGTPASTYNGDFILSSAVVSNHTVIVGAGDGMVYAFDATSGSPRWKFHTAGRVRSSPAIRDGVVYVASFDGSLYAIDINSGKQVWRYDTEGRSLNLAKFGFDRRSILSSPAVSDGVVYVGSRDSHFYAVDAAAGTLRWLCDYEKNDDMTWAISSPAVRGQVVYTGTADGHFVHALQAADGHQLWRFKMPDRVWASPAVAGSALYITNQSGSLYAVDLESGREKWHFQARSSVQSSPTVAPGVVYFGSNDGSVYALRTDSAKPLQRAVYWDAELPKMLSGFDDEPRYKGDYAAAHDFFRQRGYDVLDPTALADWMARRVADHAPSVIVFPADFLPATVAGRDPAHSVFRRYLDSGGKVVWLGIPPMLFNLTIKNSRITNVGSSWDDARQLLGISFNRGLHDEMNNNSVTSAGREWGLPEWWLGTWALPTSSDMTALSLNDRGFAGAWVKNYGGPPGIGFVYLSPGNLDSEWLYRQAMVAEFRPRKEENRSFPRN